MSTLHRHEALEGIARSCAGMDRWDEAADWWQTLIDDAYATTGPPAYQRRKDFSFDEIVEGASLYFRQADNLSGTATYRLRILNASPDRLVFNIENMTTMRYFLIPLFQPGEMQSVHFIERESQEIWRYYSIARTGFAKA
jgi:hypothetical protein